MAFRAANVVLLGSLALVSLGALLLTGPFAATAGASACGNYGHTEAHKLSQEQAEGSITCLVNRTRQRHGLNQLHHSGRLERAAQKHTSYMVRHHCFSHQCPGERSLLGRLQQVNFIVGSLIRWTCGENIAWGRGPRGTPKAIVRSWMHSPAHRWNVLNSQFRSAGVGFARGYSGGGAGIYTIDFGMRRR